MIATILPFGTSITVTYYQTTKTLTNRFVSTSYGLIQKGGEELAVYLEDVAQMSTVLYRYTPFMNVMRNGISEDLSTNQEEVRRALAYLFNTRPEIEQMHLYIREGNDSYTNYHSTISGRGKYEHIFSHPYYARLVRYNGYSLIEPPHGIYSYNQLSFIPNSEKKQVLSFHNVIRDVPSDRLLGFLSIDINLSKISAIADRLYIKGAEDFYIMNEDGVVIYSSNGKMIGRENNEAWFQRVRGKPRGTESLKWNDRHFSGVIVYDTFPVLSKHWYIAKRIPYSVLYESARQAAVTNIFIGMITLAIVLLATMAISFKITAPIKRLSANMKKVGEGKWEVDFDSLGNDEIGMLGNHFKSMVAKINELIEKEYKLEIENKSSQLRVLRSQINPHFLYNALQSIGTLALKSNVGSVYSLLTSLSHIMRYSMNMEEDVVPLGKELKHVQSYLLLQKQRFAERFEFQLDVSKELEDVPVPKMILQPIVENCFKHGFDQRDGKALISIAAHAQDGEKICLCVADNGVGVGKERLQAIRCELFGEGAKEDKRKEAIGLKNIYDRLQIYYNHQAMMSVDSHEGQGFTVVITIPKEMPEGGNARESIDR
ncbi:sensor histidine kinase [Caldibacillus thermoamylovorans]